MKTVTIYRITGVKGTPNKWCSVKPWPWNSPDLKAKDDGGTEYILPPGFSVGTEPETQFDILDNEGRPVVMCVLDGRQRLCCRNGDLIDLVLAPVAGINLE